MKGRNLISAATMIVIAGGVGCTSSPAMAPAGNQDASISSGGNGGTSSSTSSVGGTTGAGGADTSPQTGTGGNAGTPGSSTAVAGNTGSPGGGSGTAGTTGGGGAAAAAGSTGSPIDAGGGSGAEVDLWYEAESEDNTFFNVKPAKRTPVCDTNPKEGDVCTHGGGLLTWIVGPQKSYVKFNKVTVPKAGNYDVTWWYHCGEFDHYHDSDCGGKPVPAWMTWYDPGANPQPGCRPHLLSVNDKPVVGAKGEQYWQFPCFGGSWNVIHAATTTLALNAGENTIQLGAPHIGDEDSVDLDAMHVAAEGKGTPPKSVAPTEYAGDGRK